MNQKEDILQDLILLFLKELEPYYAEVSNSSCLMTITVIIAYILNITKIYSP